MQISNVMPDSTPSNNRHHPRVLHNILFKNSNLTNYFELILNLMIFTRIMILN